MEAVPAVAPSPPAAAVGGGRRTALWAGGGVVAVIGLVVVVVLLVSGGDGGDGGDGGVEPSSLTLPDIEVEIDEALVGQLEEAIADLPEPIGENDRDQVRSMIGLPDAFTISIERSGEEGDGPIVRYETWFYYELVTAYEFADGALISNMPIEPVEGLIFLPKKYDPADFERTTTWDEIAPMLSEPDSFEARELEAEYEVPIVYYAGEQLLVAFDDEGLVYVETVPLGEDES